jgi:cytochrome c553
MSSSHPGTGPGIGAIALCAGLFAAAAAFAAPNGEMLAQSCTSCHGTSTEPAGTIPPLAGRDEAELKARMTALAGGDPEATIMPRLLRDYDADDIAALAAWFAGLKQ